MRHSKLEQAARQALNWIDANAPRYVFEAIEEALAKPHKQNCACEVCRGCYNADIKAEQAEQKPVAWCYFCEDALWGFFTDHDECDPDCDNEIPLYTTPVRTKDLTDDEIYKLADDVDWAAGAYLGFARAVIAAYKERNK